MTTIASDRMRIRYTKADAAQMLSISISTLDRLRMAGKIIGRVDGGRVFFDHDELVSYSKSCTPEGDE
ncbi:helix-turn-helix domain-containing protein [Nocardia sp. NPDC046763]|uniref:helix-turn-helix domain-containing protein n=1 Tax=Nocardia sp. NPDC046763 TaxID=3155256 RepID=UPI0033D750D6